MSAPIGLLFAALAMAQPAPVPEIQWGDMASWAEWDWENVVLVKGMDRTCSPYELTQASLAVREFMPVSGEADSPWVGSCERDAAILRWRKVLADCEWLTEGK